MDNGANLQISYIKNSSLIPFKTESSISKPFLLKNLLHVPSNTKKSFKCFSISKDNLVFFEFHLYVCFVKDLATGTTLLQGTLREGLYRFNLAKINSTLVKSIHVPISPLIKQPESHSSIANLSSSSIASSFRSRTRCFNSKFSKKQCNELDLWHQHLGHLALKTIDKILFHYNLSSLMKNDFHFCYACEQGKSHKLPFPNSCTEYNELLH